MARKKAEPIPQEEPQQMEQPTEEMPAEGAMLHEEQSNSEGNATEGPEASLFLDEGENPFPSDGTTYMPPGTYDPDADARTEGMGLTDADQPAEPEIEVSGDAAEDYGALLQELGEGGGESVPRVDDGPLLLPDSAPEDDATQSNGDRGDGLSEDDKLLLAEDGENAEAADAPREPEATVRRRARRAAAPRRDTRILTINAHEEVVTEEEREATLWHEIQNAMRTRRILTGTLDTIEQTESGLTIAVINYNGFRVVIPLKEMLIVTDRASSSQEYQRMMDMAGRRLTSRLGAEIDFIVKGIENKTRSIVASRRDAMYRKRQTFFMDTDADGQPMIYEGRVVQARVVAVAEKVIRVEVFGVECSIQAAGISLSWFNNARDDYHVGDHVLVRVLTIERPDVENIRITCDIRSVSHTDDGANLRKCVPQGRYVGRVTDVRSGVVFVRLNNGVNALAHSCYDVRHPGKKDDVSFVVTRIDPEHNVALGIITRIIRQNL